MTRIMTMITITMGRMHMTNSNMLTPPGSTEGEPVTEIIISVDVTVWR